MEDRKLSVNDPVDESTLAKLRELSDARRDFASRLLDLEQEKVRILAGTHKIDAQMSRLYEQVLIARGLSPNTIFELDAQTGKLAILKPQPGGEFVPSVKEPDEDEDEDE